MRQKCLFLVLCLALPLWALPRASSDWLAKLKVEPGRQHRNLVLYPVVGPKSELPRFMTLDQALLAQNLKVSEVSESGEVNSLSLTNTGGVPIFVMAGEILDGAKQDRVLQHDLWLPARSNLRVSAFCVEQGRWAYEGKKSFASKSTVANLNVRAQARAGKDQSVVWKAVNETQQKAGYSAPTQSLNAAYEDPKMRTRVESYLTAFRDLPRARPEMVGVVVQVGDRVVAVDCFPDRDLLLGLWTKTLKSYALEAVSDSSKTARVDRGRAANFLRQGGKLSSDRIKNPGEGSLFGLSGGSISGELFELSGQVIHFELFNAKR